MVSIREVATKKDIKEFIEFPLRLYKNVYQFVPPLYSDEKKMLKRGGSPDVAESVFYLAERDGKTVGRIQGIIQKQYNELHGTKRVRFTRFDSIDDSEVSGALFGAVEEWARGFGMTELCGPLGYNDLEREGLLIEGFEEDSTFEEQYNYEYYGRLCEAAGLEKEVDWLEFELTAPDKKNAMLERVSERVLDMHKLHVVDTSKMSKKEYINRYRDGIFNCIDECYSKLYGTVPITPESQDELVEQFIMIVDKRFLFVICDENERVVAFGLCFPSIGNAVKKSGGRLTPAALLRLIGLLKNPKTLDLALIGVLPEYQNTGVNAVILNEFCDAVLHGGYRCETNLNLETNTQVMAQWKYFNARQHKRRRAYVKTIR